MAPGAVNTTDMRLRKAPFNNAPSQFSTDGGGTYNNEFTIDGVPNTFSDSTQVRVAFSPPQASIGEFKVQTSMYDAAIGHTQGSLVNISTKGGTNDIHGSVWWWIRNKKFDTPTIFQNRSGQSLPQYTDNRYGVSSGGPVFIPKVYNGKNKTFWQFTWEANKFGDPERRRHHLHRAARGLENRRPLRPAEARRRLPGLRSRHHRRRSQRALQPHALRRQHHPGQPHRSHRQEHPGALSAAQPGRHHRRTQQLLHLRPHHGRLLDHHRPLRSRLQREGPHVHPRQPRFLAGGQEPQLPLRSHQQERQRHLPEPHQPRHRARRSPHVQPHPGAAIPLRRHRAGIPGTARQPGLRPHLAGLLAGLRGALPEGQGGHSQHQRRLAERAQRFGIRRRHRHLPQPRRVRQLHLDEGQSQRALRPGLPRLPRLQRPPLR